MRSKTKSTRPLERSKVTRRDGSMEAFDFYDTYNPRQNKVDKLRTVPWPVIERKEKIPSQRAYNVRRPHMETRSMFLTQLSPEQ